MCPFAPAAPRDWSVIEGWCFRNLIVGKTSTLNFYQALNASAAPPERVRSPPPPPSPTPLQYSCFLWG